MRQTHLKYFKEGMAERLHLDKTAAPPPYSSPPLFTLYLHLHYGIWLGVYWYIPYQIISSLQKYKVKYFLL